MFTTPNDGGEPAKDAAVEGGETPAPPSTQETEVENEEQKTEEASADDLLSEAEGLLRAEKLAEPTKPIDKKAQADFQLRDESVRLDAQLLQQAGKSNIEIVQELTESGLYPADQINRLKKLMATGGSLEVSQDAGDMSVETDTERDKFNKWHAEENLKNERETSIQWFTKTYAKELGINAKTNSVAIESRKKLLNTANTLYNQTSLEHRDFKKSLQLAAASLGLTNKVKTQEAIKKAVKTLKTKVDPDTGEPQKTTKSSYTFTELAEIIKKDKKEGKRILRLQREGKIKLTNDQSG